ncbi:spermidine dehydrogenase, partial [Pseudomonas sp. MWU12-2115]
NATLVYTKVVLTNWDSSMKLRVHELYCPSMLSILITLDYSADIVGYQHPRNPSDLMCPHMVYVPTIASSAFDPRT